MTRVDSVTMAEVVTGKLDCCLLAMESRCFSRYQVQRKNI
jgi:hypothetical protein